MKILEIRDAAELQTLRTVWDSLLERSSSATLFLTWEWVTAWWSAYGKSGELRVLMVVDDDGTLVGIAPLRHQTVVRYGRSAPALAFIGDGSNDTDYLDFIVATGQEERVMNSLAQYWLKQMRAEPLLQLNEVPAASANLPHLKRLAEDTGILWREADVPCGVVHLPESWEEYLGALRPRFRTKVRSVLRNLEGRPEARFHFCELPEELDRLLPALYDLHGRRWATEGQAGVFGWDRKRGFYFRLSPLLLERGRLRFSWLEWNGSILACQYGFVYGNSYFQLQEGYEPAAEHLSVGMALRAWSIRELQREGVREYDFLGGIGRHKLDWGAAAKQSKRILTGTATLRNRIIINGSEWEQRVKDAVCAIAPEKLLAARRARFSRSPSEPSGGGEALRKAVANCYFHLRVPRVMHPIRNAYQFTIARNGSGLKVSCKRRSQPAARVLYYHRVNDEADAFFPAMSTRLFEAQMRHIARYYNVVSVPELLDRLQAGAPEPILAITFDDGYQDNYQNAFPILRRYNLPATIFLSTGAIDSRQPLWFETLAHALKTSECQYLDIETDFPRRFWLRDQAERLRTNDRLFELLRRLPDNERKKWLAEILFHTRVADSGAPQNKMLTWDQVRLMKKEGIDFGGHTVTHPFLSKLTRPEAVWEISECKRRIEEKLQCRVEHFAYPNGRSEDFAESTKSILRDAGYRAAMTTLWGMNDPSTDLMELRRGGPWEESSAMFAYKLDWYDLMNA